MKMDSKYSKLSKNTIILTVGNMSGKLLQFIMLPFYTSILTTDEYGVIDLMMTFVYLLYPIVSVNIAESILRFMLDESRSEKSIFRCGVFAMLTCSFLTCLCSLLIRFNGLLQDYYLYFGGYIISYVLFLSCSAFIKGLNKVFEYMTASIISSVISVFSGVYFLSYKHLGIQGYFVSYILGFVVASIYILIISREYISFKFNVLEDKSNIKNMCQYSLPMIPNSISWWISNSSDKLILKLFYPVSVVGLYSAAYKIPSAVNFLSGNFISAWQLSSVEGFGGEVTNTFYYNVYKQYAFITFLFSSILITLSKPLAYITLKNDFFNAWHCSSILLVGMAACNLGTILGSVFTASKKTKYLFHSTLLGATMNIVLNIVLIPFWGAAGAAIATGVSYLSIWLYRLYLSKKMFGMNFFSGRELMSLIILSIQTVLSIITDDSMLSVVLMVLLVLIYHDELAILTKYMGRTLKKWKK